MPQYPFTIYDTALFSTSGEVVHTLFQVAVSQDSTHTPFFTNMRGSGQFPTNEKFLIQDIEVYADTDLPANDREGIWLGSFLRIVYNDLLILSAPLRIFAGHNAFSGVYLQATAALEADFGLMGMGYSLPIPQEIKGGTAFKVEVGQGTALANASQKIKVALKGLLTTGAS